MPTKAWEEEDWTPCDFIRYSSSYQLLLSLPLLMNRLGFIAPCTERHRFLCGRARDIARTHTQTQTGQGAVGNKPFPSGTGGEQCSHVIASHRGRGERKGKSLLCTRSLLQESNGREVMVLWILGEAMGSVRGSRTVVASERERRHGEDSSHPATM